MHGIGNLSVKPLAHSPIPLKPHAADRPAAVVRLTVPFAGDDAALVSAIRAGNASAKAELFQRYAPQLERLITHVVGYDSELADLLQETFASALRSIHGLKDANALRPWLFRIAACTAKKALRTRTRRRWLRYFTDDEDEARHEPQVNPPDADALRASREVYAILDRLPVDERLAFALRYINGLELASVAAACDVSLATVKRRLQRAERSFVAAAKAVPILVDCMESGERWKIR